MSNPNIPNITPTISLSVGQTVPLLLASIALEELALAHLLNAEAEKLQFVLGTLTPTRTTFSPATVSLSNLLDVDASVQRTLRDIIKKEMLLEFKFQNVLDLIATLPVPPVPPSCPNVVPLSSGATVRFTGLTNGGLTWNYEIDVPDTPNFIIFAPLFPCAITNFVECASNPPALLCIPTTISGACIEGNPASILFLIVTDQLTNTISFTLNQQFPIGTIDAFNSINTGSDCFNICGPMCS